MRILKYRKTDRPKAVNRQRHADNAARVKLHVTKGDTVRVMRGEDKGKEGKILRVDRKTGRVDFPAPIAASNVMLLDPKTGAPTRTRRRLDADGTKERISVKSGDAIP